MGSRVSGSGTAERIVFWRRCGARGDFVLNGEQQKAHNEEIYDTVINKFRTIPQPGPNSRCPGTGNLCATKEVNSLIGGKAVHSSEPLALLLTVDVGGSHVSAALCAMDDLRVIQLTEAPLGGVSSFEGFVDLLYLLSREVSGWPQRMAGASLAVPGPFDCAAGMSLMKHKLQWLYGKDLRGALAARFGWRPDQLCFLNDASAFLLGELNAGNARGAERAVGLTLGTGIGSAFAVDGHCVMDGKGVPRGGEIWDYAYREATVEDLISTRALKAEYRARTGKDLEVKEMAARAAADPCARQVFEKLGCDLGHVIRDVIVPFDPDVVVVGGGIARSAHLFIPIAQRELEDAGVRVLPSTLFEQAQLVGAAAHWRDARVSGSPAGDVVSKDSVGVR
jgi:glucokinase